MKKLLCLVLCLSLVFSVVPAALAASDNAAMNPAMLEGWVDNMYLLAYAQDGPLNAPITEEIKTDDGYPVEYSFGTYYLSTPGWQAGSVINAIRITAPEVGDPMGLQLGATMDTLLSLYPNDNPSQTGDTGFAVLYMAEMLPTQALWGWLVRDGETVYNVQYACQYQLGDTNTYRDAGITYTIDTGIVTEIYAYGLASEITLEDVQAILSDVSYRQEQTSYAPGIPVPTNNSYGGKEFNENDLFFGNTAFASLTPDDTQALFGTPVDDAWLTETDGSYYRIITYTDAEADFRYDANKNLSGIDALLIDSGVIPGPRSITIGTTISQVLSAFLYQDGLTDGNRTVLYGTEGTAPYGEMAYSTASDAEILYVATLTDGRTVALRCMFENNMLSQMMVYFR